MSEILTLGKYNSEILLRKETGNMDGEVVGKFFFIFWDVQIQEMLS